MFTDRDGNGTDGFVDGFRQSNLKFVRKVWGNFETEASLQIEVSKIKICS